MDKAQISYQDKVSKKGNRTFQKVFSYFDKDKNKELKYFQFSSADKVIGSKRKIKLESDEKTLAYEKNNRYFFINMDKKNKKGEPKKETISRESFLRHIKTANNYNTAKELAKKKEELRDVDTISGNEFLQYYKESTKTVSESTVNRLVNLYDRWIRQNKPFKEFDTKHLVIDKRTGNPIYIKSSKMVNNDFISKLAKKQRDYRKERDWIDKEKGIKRPRSDKEWGILDNLRFKMGELRYRIWEQLYNEKQYSDLELDTEFILG